MSTRMRGRTVTGLVAFGAAAAVLGTLAGPAGAAQAAPGTTGVTNSSAVVAAAVDAKPLTGGWSGNYTWYNANIGSAQIYRSYDVKFQYPTWQQTVAYQNHGNATEDYSFQLPPGDVASGKDDAILQKFIATTPKDIILTNYHEPEQEIAAGLFTAAQFRASLVRLSALVRAQNAVDGGTRRVSVILMYDTIYGFKNRNPMDYWPGADATGRNYADLISFDTYALPHATGTPGVPKGYTDGLKWQTAKYLLDPSIAFAKKINSPWMISEFGFLEDIHDPMHKANAITSFVAYARSQGAVTVEYWDYFGTRGDWRLMYSQNATNAWRDVVQGP